ncbi:MAG: ABC transporter permease [Actinomycetes bacterium]
MATAVDVSPAGVPQPSPAALADRYALTPVGRRPPLLRYLNQLWVRRHFITTLAVARVIARNHEDRLGVFWNVLRPLLLAAIYGLVFGVLLPSSTRPHNFTAFIVIGVIVFTFSGDTFTKGSRSITRNLHIVRALHFPKALLPVAQALEESIATIPAFVVMVLIVLATGVTPNRHWIYIAPAFLLQAVFSLGLAFFAARVTVSIRDFAQLLPFILRMLFYLSGIFYDINRFTHPAWLVYFVKGNPFHIFIAIDRQALLGGHYAPKIYWAYALAWAVGLCTVMFLFFWRAEERYGRE